MYNEFVVKCLYSYLIGAEILLIVNGIGKNVELKVTKQMRKQKK